LTLAPFPKSSTKNNYTSGFCRDIYMLYVSFQKNTKLRLIVSSATVDAEQLRVFFSSGKEDKSAAILSVEGRLYPVAVNYVLGKFLLFACMKAKNN
jgi:hypothetical protein